MPRKIATFGAALTGMFAFVTLLALIVSRVLSGAGAIGFLSNHDGNPDVYVLDISRGTLHNLTDNSAYNGGFVFSPDKTRMAFESNKDGNTEIYMMTLQCPGLFATCGGIRQLTDHETDSRNPVWSPDGIEIAYVYDVSWQDADNEIYVMNLDTGTNRNLTNDPADDSMPVWSPDGSRIAFMSDRDGNVGNSEVYVMDSDGRHLKLLNMNDGFDMFPAWSPLGDQITFGSSSRDGSSNGIISINPDTESRVDVFQGSVLTFMVSWSPDANYIAFISNDADTDPPNAINLVDMDSHAVREFVIGTTYDSRVSWSPDSQWLAFLCCLDTGYEITIIDVNGHNMRRLTSLGSIGLPTWWR